MTSRIMTSGGGAVVGQVGYFGAVPDGWIKANGAQLSRTDYGDLFEVVGVMFGSGDGSTTFHLPDLRGEFIRCADDGRGVDSGRSVGSFQSDENKSHGHTFPYYTAWSEYGGGTGLQNNNAGGAGLSNKPTTNVGGSESRPRNRALLACIKY